MISDEKAEAIMDALEKTIEQFDEPAFIALSIDGECFSSSNEAMDNAKIDKLNEMHAGMSIAIVQGILDPAVE